jgi:hypothetical protein
MAGLVSSHTLSFINQRHMSVEKLDVSRRELIELYLQLELPKAWGDGKTVAVDGTMELMSVRFLRTKSPCRLSFPVPQNGRSCLSARG